MQIMVNSGSVQLDESGIRNAVDPSGVTLGMLTLYSIYALAAFIPSIAVTVRRLHDRNMSGWWYPGFIVASLIPVVGIIAAIAFLVIMFLDGTPGTNRFGPDPKGRANSDVFA